jgi:hypothetical protein
MGDTMKGGRQRVKQFQVFENMKYYNTMSRPQLTPMAAPVM